MAFSAFHNRFFKNQRGQGLVEYLILVALMAVASIGIVRVLNQTVSAKLASATLALQGKKKSITAETVTEGLYEKKDLSDFINGVGSSD